MNPIPTTSAPALLTSISKTPTVEGIITLDPPPPIERLDITDENNEIVNEMVSNWNEYCNKRNKFVEQRKNLLSLGIAPIIEDYKNLHEEIWELYHIIEALKISLVQDGGESRTLSVVDRVDSLSSSITSSSSNSSASQSSTSSRASSVSSIGVGMSTTSTRGIITVIGGDNSTVSEAGTLSPVYEHDWKRKDSRGEIFHHANLEPKKEGKESKTSFSAYPFTAVGVTTERVESISSTALNREVARLAAEKALSTCNKHIMNETDINKYSPEIQVELRGIKKNLEALRTGFETMVAVADFCSLQEIADQPNSLNRLNKLVREQELLTGIAVKEEGTKAAPKKKAVSFSSLTSETSVTEADVQRALAQFRELGELDESQFQEQAKVYNRHRQAFIKRVESGRVFSLRDIEDNLRDLLDVKKKIEQQANSTLNPSRFASASSHSNSAMTSRTQYDAKEEGKGEKISSANQDQVATRAAPHVELGSEGDGTVLEALGSITVLDENQFTKEGSKVFARKYNEKLEELIEAAMDGDDIESLEIRVKQLERYREKIFILEEILKTADQVKKIEIDNTFLGEARAAAEEYNRQYKLLSEDTRTAFKDAKKAEMEKILVRIKDLKKYQDEVLKLKTQVILASSSSSSSVAIASLSQVDKERYLRELNQLQAKIVEKVEEIDPSFFENVHRMRVKKYNALRLKVMGALDFIRLQVNELRDNHIQSRIKNMELWVKKVEQENRGLYDLLLS